LQELQLFCKFEQKLPLFK